MYLDAIIAKYSYLMRSPRYTRPSPKELRPSAARGPSIQVEGAPSPRR